MRVAVQIETHDRRLGFNIAGRGTSLTSGTIVDAPGGVRVEYRGSLLRKGLGFPEILEFIIDASVNVELALFAAWLYDKVKASQVERIVIRHTEVTEISEEGIRKVLEQEIDVQR